MFKNIQARHVLLVMVLVILAAMLGNRYKLYRNQEDAVAASQIKLQEKRDVINQLRYDYIVAEPGHKRVIAEDLIRKIESLSMADTTVDLISLVRKLKNKV